MPISLDSLMSWGWISSDTPGQTIVLPSKISKVQTTTKIDVSEPLPNYITENVKHIAFDINNPLRRIWLKGQKSDRLVSLGQIQTVNEFVRSVWQALQLHRPSIVFEPAYPIYVLDKEDQAIKLQGSPAPSIPEEIITWSIVRRAPGSIDHTAFAKSKEIRPRVREELVYETTLLQGLDDPEPETSQPPGQLGPDKELSRVIGSQVEGQYFDNLIQFDIWSRDNKKAEDLADYLEKFFIDFHGMFIELGVVKLHFHSRVRDEFLLKWRNGLCNRSLLFYVRTETVRSAAIREIRSINVSTEVRSFLDAVTQSGQGAFVDDVRSAIVDKWVKPRLT